MPLLFLDDVGVIILIIITESMHTAVCSKLAKLLLQMIVVNPSYVLLSLDKRTKITLWVYHPLYHFSLDISCIAIIISL